MDYSIPPKEIKRILEMEGLDSSPDRPARVDGVGGNPHYQDYIRDNDCVGCLEMGIIQEKPTQHHHAFTAGTAMRCPDEYGIPLCAECHSMFHGLNQGGKITFLERTGLPNYYAPVAMFLANYCRNRKVKKRRQKRRAVYYFKQLYSWLQTEQAQDILQKEKAARKVPAS